MTIDKTEKLSNFLNVSIKKFENNIKKNTVEN